MRCLGSVGGDARILDSISLTTADAQALIDAIGADNISGEITVEGKAP